MPRIQLAYPKIPQNDLSSLGRCIAFEKYDGTNLHWVWCREIGWHAFGTRRDRFDLDNRGVSDFAANHSECSEAAELFLNQFAGPLEQIFRSQSFYDSESITVFTEFLGSRSFAGRHRRNDPKRLVLFDVKVDSGFLGPERFVTDFQTVNIAKVVYRGKLTGAFTEDVRRGKFNLNEGVVCKGGNGGEDLWMVKIKTNAYMKRLQQAFASDWERYWE